MTDRVLVPPTAEPIHLDEAKKHLRLTTASEDDKVKRAMRAARRHLESYCRRALVRQQHRLTRDCFAAEIELPVGPLRAVQSVQYLDDAGVLQTLAANTYRLSLQEERPAIRLDFGKVWPPIYPVRDAVRITYTVGHVVPISAVDVNTEFLTAKGHDLVADEPVQVSNSGGAVPVGLNDADTYYVKAPTADTLQLAAAAGGAAVDLTGAGTGQSYVGQVPDDLVNALLLLVTHFFNARGSHVVGTLPPSEYSDNARTLMAPYRTVRFA